MVLGVNYSEKDLFGGYVDIQAKAKPTSENLEKALKKLKKERQYNFIVVYIQEENGTIHSFYFESLDDYNNNTIKYEKSKNFYERDFEKISFIKAKKILKQLIEMEE